MHVKEFHAKNEMIKVKVIKRKILLFQKKIYIAKLTEHVITRVLNLTFFDWYSDI